jgi:hypothetical protein
MSLCFVTNAIKCFTEVTLANQFRVQTNHFEDKDWLKVILLLSYILRILNTLYITLIFTRTVIYFIQLKKQALLESGNGQTKLSRFNIFIITSIFVVLFARVTDTLALDVITVIRLYTDVYQNQILEALWLIFRMIMVPMMNLVELLMITYMLWFQDQSQSQELD